MQNNNQEEEKKGGAAPDKEVVNPSPTSTAIKELVPLQQQLKNVSNIVTSYDKDLENQNAYAH